MPNKNYRRGVYFERKAKKELEAQGDIVIRSAGSHGPFDLVSIGPYEIRLIQIKVDCSPTKDELKKLAEIKTPHQATKELWTYHKTGELCIARYTHSNI